MNRYAIPTLLALAATVAAQVESKVDTPLAEKRIPYNAIPYQVDTQNGVRGAQTGYNICNGTTENQDSLCQTAIVNDITDFCLWAPQKLDSIANTEGEEVAWCTKPGHGSRLIPKDALKGVQVLKTSEYIQIVGFVDQTKINIMAGDYGGELDPHGADLRGNPLGGLIYSTAFGAGGSSYEQVIEWTNFMGGDQFCMKICNPAGAHDADYCQHVFDRIGCAYNDPNAAQTGVFETCDADLMDYPGVYTLAGQTLTYTQPPESLGAISTMPYEPRVPASSNCVQHKSDEIYAALASVTAASVPSSSAGASASASGSGSAAVVTATGSAKVSVRATTTASRTVGAASADTTGAASGAARMVGSMVAVGAVFVVGAFIL